MGSERRSRTSLRRGTAALWRPAESPGTVSPPRLRRRGLCENDPAGAQTRASYYGGKAMAQLQQFFRTNVIPTELLFIRAPNTNADEELHSSLELRLQSWLDFI